MTAELQLDFAEFASRFPPPLLLHPREIFLQRKREKELEDEK
jgi:hypothetical protein